MLRVIWQWFGRYVNEFRERFKLPPLNSADFYQILASTPLLGAYSPTVIPPPLGWPETAYITGYWFLDHSPEWQPSPALQEFLEQGEAPVYIGFGSMAARSPEQYAEIALEALALSGRRGVLATGWGGLQVLDVPENVAVIDAAPHDWLFPRMAAVVHHGGAGTTAEGLRAGIPTQIIPFIVDQRFWGSRVRALGAGPQPIAAKGLTALKLADAIRSMTTNPGMKSRAQEIGRMIRSEDGVGRAVQIIQQYLGV
jgi:sterol 3beta-glucosyltransferase